MPRVASVKSLQELCLKNIANSIDSWCPHRGQKVYYHDNSFDVHSPFESMPSGLLEQLAELLGDYSTHRKMRHFELLITSQLETLNIAWLTNLIHEDSSINQQKKEETEFTGLLALIVMRHPQLKVLKWSHYSSVGSLPVYQMFLPMFPKLQELYITSTLVTNRCLHVIGANCKELRILDAKGCHMVTDDGIKGLCAIFDDSGSKHERLGQCKSIHTLKIRNARITKKGVYLALKYLPALRVFGFHSSFQILAELQEECNFPNLLDSLIGASDLVEPFVPYKSGSLGRVASLCSSLKKVEINIMPGLTDQVLLGLLELKSLCQLSLFGDYLYDGDHEITFDGGVVPLLKAFGSSLTLFSLTGVEELHVNVRAIIEYCPELEYLKLENETGDIITAPLDEDEHPPSKRIKKEMILKKLKQLTLFFPSEERESTKVALEILLSSPSLVNVKLYFFEAFSDDVLQKAFDVHQFRNLESLSLNACSSVTQQGISLFMNEKNSLKKLELSECELLTEEFANELRNIARQMNWDVDITHV